jgi:Uma2 family endonuclease
MLTAEKKKKYTGQDYSLLEEGAPFQLIHNDLVMSPAPSLLHQLILGEFYDALKAYVKQHDPKGFVVLSPIDIHLDEGNIYQPDMAYISAAKKQVIVKDRIEGAPDLIIEILSPSNAYYDLRQKKDIYEKYGVKEYIIVDPLQENAEVHILEDGVYVLKQKAAKTQQLNSILLAGLVFDLAKIA